MPEFRKMGAFAISIQDKLPAAQGTVPRAKERVLADFESFYRRHVGHIYAICLRMSADSARAEDATQQTFIRAWERLETFRGDSRIEAWLCRIAVNCLLADRRSRSRRPELQVEDIQAVASAKADRPTVQGQGIELERAIADLPHRAREVFVLHDVEGYRHEEIADLLDIAPGTSKSQLHRARRLLREVLHP